MNDLVVNVPLRDIAVKRSSLPFVENTFFRHIYPSLLEVEITNQMAKIVSATGTPTMRTKLPKHPSSI